MSTFCPFLGGIGLRLRCRGINHKHEIGSGFHSLKSMLKELLEALKTSPDPLLVVIPAASES